MCICVERPKNSFPNLGMLKRKQEEKLRIKVEDVRKLAVDILSDPSNYNNITTLIELVHVS